MTRTNTSRRTLPAPSGSTFLAATRPIGRVALSCGLAGALSLGAAGTALASGHDGATHGGNQGRGSGQKSSAQSHSAAPQKSEGHPPAAARGAGSGQAATRKGSGSQHAPRPHQQKTSPARTSTPQRGKDPRGNNGTVKVDGPAWDARVDNEPHPSCAFRVTFFGFDEGQTADITVTGIAPTGGGVLLHETAVPTSDDRAGGAAHDFDGATRVFTADDLGLDGVTPHPKQGYHLKVAVDSLQAPGGAKQKVLWLEPCATEASVPPPVVGGPEQGGEKPSGEVPGSQPEVPAGPEAPVGSETPEMPATSELPRPSAPTAPPALRAEEAAYRESATAAAVTGRTPARTAEQASALPTSLAFTGAAGLEMLALTGAAAAAAGAGLLVARRRAGARAR